MAASSTSYQRGHKHSPETLAKMSNSKRGKPAYNKGVRRGVNFKQRTGRYVSCKVCCNFLWVERNQIGRKKFCSKGCKYIGMELKNTFGGGEKHPGYIDGRAGRDYPKEFKQSLKTRIKKRDGYACRICRVTEDQYIERYGRGLCVNHIDFNKQNCDESNLNVLCIGCNSKINWHRKFWSAFFQNERGVLHG